MKKIRILSIFLLLCLVFSLAAPCASALDEPQLEAVSAILVDMDTGTILFEKDKDRRSAPASLTKIMTMLLVTEAIERNEIGLQDMITAPADCRYGMNQYSSTAGIQPGEIMSVEDLMYCAFLLSANEACNILAVAVSGSRMDFVKLMNQRAEELGCTGTHFVNTNGLTADDHYTTAYDLYLMASEAMRHELFSTMCNTIYHEVQPTNMYYSVRSFYNTNALISEKSEYGNQYLYDGASGVKTGYTRAAGYCLVSTAQRQTAHRGLDNEKTDLSDSLHLCCVVLGCLGELNSNRIGVFGHFEDTITLYNWGFENYAIRDLLTPSDAVYKATVRLGEGEGTVLLRPRENFSALMPIDVTEEDVDIRVNLYDERLEAPISEGTVLGSADIIVRGQMMGSVDLINTVEVGYAKTEVMRQQAEETLSRPDVRVFIIIILAIFAVYFALVLRYRTLRRKHLKEKRQAQKRRKQEREERLRAAVSSAQSKKEPTVRIRQEDIQSQESAESQEENGDE